MKNGNQLAALNFHTKDLVGHAVPDILYTDTRLQFVVTGTALLVLVAPQ